MEFQKSRRGIQSIEVGGQLLLVLADTGESMLLKDLSRQAGMPPAKAHPYLVSFGKIGLIEQDPVSGRYQLGPLALQLGLASLRRLDPLKVALTGVAELASRMRQTVALAVWGNMGPTIVHIEDSAQPIHMNMRPGTVLSLRGHATGQVFEAFLPEHLTQAWREREADSAPVGGDSLDEVRTHALARAIGRPIAGVNALSAAVFDHSNHIVLAITALGMAASFDTAWDGPLAKELLAYAAEVSHRLGHVPSAE